jgi:hypothetical protein
MKLQFKITGVLVLILALVSLTQVSAQNTILTSIYESGDGTGGGVKIVSVHDDYDEYNTKSTFYLLLTDGSWAKAEDLGGFMENGDINVKIKYNSKIYELYAGMENPDKLTRVAPDGTKRIYWKKK